MNSSVLISKIQLNQPLYYYLYLQGVILRHSYGAFCIRVRVLNILHAHSLQQNKLLQGKLFHEGEIFKGTAKCNEYSSLHTSKPNEPNNKKAPTQTKQKPKTKQNTKRPTKKK